MTDSQVADFIKLMTSHEVRLRSFALSLIPHWADADEVLQQAYLAMWQKFSTFEPGTSFFSWGARFVHLTALDFRKRERRTRNLICFSDEFLQSVARESALAADDLAAREAVLSQCRQKLPPKQQHLLDLRYRDDYSGEQMAVSTGMSTEAVYQALARIRKTLFDCVKRGMQRELGTI